MAWFAQQQQQQQHQQQQPGGAQSSHFEFINAPPPPPPLYSTTSELTASLPAAPLRSSQTNASALHLPSPPSGLGALGLGLPVAPQHAPGHAHASSGDLTLLDENGQMTIVRAKTIEKRPVKSQVQEPLDAALEQNEDEDEEMKALAARFAALKKR